MYKHQYLYKILKTNDKKLCTKENKYKRKILNKLKVFNKLIYNKKMKLNLNNYKKFKISLVINFKKLNKLI